MTFDPSVTTLPLELAFLIEAMAFLIITRVTLAGYRAYEFTRSTAVRWAVIGFGLLALNRLVRLGYFTTIAVNEIPVPTHHQFLLVNTTVTTVGFGGILYALHRY